MIHRTPSFLLLLSLLLLSSCRSNSSKGSARRQQDEALARPYLDQARTALRAKEFAAAKEQIRLLRHHCRYALEAREEGIVLLDSIELLAAQHQLQRTDSLLQIAQEQTPQKAQLRQAFEEQCRQIKFYQRKLRHDQQQRRHHD